MIVQTALPLLATHGAALTTAEVARAAGIGEATVFRAFPDKQALMDACVAEVLRPDPLLQRLAAVSPDQPLVDRLTEVAAAVQAHLGRMGAVLSALHAAGRPASRARRATSTQPGAPVRVPAARREQPGRNLRGRTASVLAVRAAIADLLAPDSDRLRLPADRLAELFLALLSPRGPLGDDPPAPGELVDLFLHGALAREATVD